MFLSHALETFHHLGHPPLDTLYSFNVLLVLRCTKLHTVMEVRPHQCSVEWDDHLPRLPSYAVLDAPQDMSGPFGCQGILLTHVQLATSPKPQISFCRAALQRLSALCIFQKSENWRNQSFLTMCAFYLTASLFANMWALKYSPLSYSNLLWHRSNFYICPTYKDEMNRLDKIF